MQGASPLFVKVRSVSGAMYPPAAKMVHVDIMQIVAMEPFTIHPEPTQLAGPISEKWHDARLVPGIRLHLIGGQTIDCWDEDETGAEEINNMKTSFLRQAMNPGILTPQQVAAGMR